MDPTAAGSRQLKRYLIPLLEKEDVTEALAEIARIPPAKAVSPLIALFCHADERVRWHAVTAVGTVAACLAADAMESARIVMRRLMWNLNEESGGIGWGAPEAMGEIMAVHEELAREYHCILTSYISPGGNFIEFEPLQRGVLWGIGRLAYARPCWVQSAGTNLASFLTSSDEGLRGTAAWAAGAFEPAVVAAPLRRLTEDPARLHIYMDRHLIERTIGSLASASLKCLEQQSTRPDAVQTDGRL